MSSLVQKFGLLALLISMLAFSTMPLANECVNSASNPREGVACLVDELNIIKNSNQILRSELQKVSDDLEKTQQQLVENWEILESNQKTPFGLIGFFDSKTCPSGWSVATALQGRYVVGVVDPEEVTTVVGDALKKRENRSTGEHTHAFVDRYNKHNASDGYLGGDGSSGSHPFSKMTEGVENSVPGTNAPYIQLLACIKEQNF